MMVVADKRYQGYVIDFIVESAKRLDRARDMPPPEAWEAILRRQARLQNEIAIRLSDALREGD